MNRIQYVQDLVYYPFYPEQQYDKYQHLHQGLECECSNTVHTA